MAKYFVFLFVDEPILRSCLNLSIFTLNPLEKWPAHVTIAGPFSEKLSIPRSLKFTQQVSVLGRGRFTNESRSTVFLHAGSRDIHARMVKPDFPSPIPHLSLYSGPDRELADLLYEGLGGVNVFGVFHSRQLEVVESKQQYNFNFRTQVDTGLSPLSSGKTLDELRELEKEERVAIAIDALNRGFAYSARRSALWASTHRK